MTHFKHYLMVSLVEQICIYQPNLRITTVTDFSSYIFCTLFAKIPPSLSGPAAQFG